MSSAAKFDELYYLLNNADVLSAVDAGGFDNALEHFTVFGGKELRAPNEYFSPSYYLAHNSDIVAAVQAGFFKTPFHHYQLFGELENRSPSPSFDGFDPQSYFAANPDVAAAQSDNSFISAIHHFIDFGQFEGRPGSGINAQTFFLTSGLDEIQGSFGTDTFISGPNTLQAGDQIDGMGDKDFLSISLSADEQVSRNLLNILTNFSGIENIAISAGILSSLDTTSLSDLEMLELTSGKTPANSVITITLGQNQNLKINNVESSSNRPLSLSDGGIKVIQEAGEEILNLALENVGPESRYKNKDIFIDVAGLGVETVNVSTIDESYIVLQNSGGNLSNLNVQGSGILEISNFLSDTIKTLNAGNSSTSLRALFKTGDHTITTGSGNDTIIISGGSNNIVLGDGHDSLEIRDGVDNFARTGAGADSVIIAAGNNSITTDDDTDVVTISGGVNTVETGAGSDRVLVSGGNNTLFMSDGNDVIDVSGGTSAITAGDGDDTITATGSTTFTSLDGGAGTDTLNVFSTGSVVLPAFSNFENFFLSDTVHQSLDFSLSTTLSGVELASGTTIDGSTITITVGAGQSVTLDSITDGDTAAASLADGGIVIAQGASINSLDLTLDDVGPSTSIANQNVFIDIAGTGVTTANVTSGNDSFVVISNSGGALTNLALLGSGSMALGTLPTSITNINGASASANLTLTIGSTGSNTLTGGTGDDAITLTGGTNIVNMGPGNDTVTTSTNLTAGDRIDGGDGTDTFEVIHTGLATVPSTSNLTSIERIAIQDTVHQSLDFSPLTGITGIELDSGTTVDGATIVTTLGDNQSLTLDSITDGDTAAASLADGGIQIAQANTVTSLDLTIDDIGPSSASTNQNVFIDIAGSGVATANITSANTSYIVLENSGGTLSTLNLSGSGTLGLSSALANSVTTINAASSTANVTVTPGTAGSTVTTNSGNDEITLTGGANTVTTNSGQDSITVTGGTNNVNTGSGNDTINLNGGSNTIVTGNNNDTVTASAGNNDIDTDSGDDQVVLTGGTNDVNTGANDDTVTLSGGTETVDMGSGNDTVEAGANLSTSDTVDGGDGTADAIEITSALTDALTARLSNFEILEIKGGGGVTHDITGLTGLTSLKASGALTGAVVITDLAEAAEVDISAAISNDLTINQINSGGGSDTLTFDFSGSNYTTGGSIIAPNIEAVTLKTSASGAKTISGATFADATNVTITATGANLIINDLTATNITALDASSSNKIVTITTGADVFSSAFTYSGSSNNERLDFDGATLAVGTVFELGQGGQDTLTLNADAVATTVRTSATTSNRALSIRDDATSTDTASFTSGSDTFDYNGSLSHDSVTSVVAASGATLQAAVTADADATVYVIQDADGDVDLETAINNFADNVGRGRANTLETEAVDTGLLSYTGLDAAFDSSDIVLIAIDSETNEEGSTANNGGTAVYRFQNSDTSTVDTVLSSELELIGVFQDAALGTGDFV